MQDSFQRTINYLRVSVTDLCNLRCAYCMPPEGVVKRCHRDVMSYEEIVEVVTACAQLGVTKVRITGGEPLIRRDVPQLCAAVQAVPGIREVTLTTNGVLLGKYAQALKDAGVSRVNVSLDTLNPEKYAQITGGGRLEDVRQGIEEAIRVGLAPMKLNAVLIGGFNDDEIGPIVDFTRDHDIEIRFIELMPMGPGASFPPEAFLSGDVILERRPELVPVDAAGGVARLYRLPDGVGKVGIISPLSHHFCRSCNRLRLTSEGALKPCLHSNQEIPVRGYHGQALLEQIKIAIGAKPQQHGDLDHRHASEAGRTMNTIGG